MQSLIAAIGALIATSLAIAVVAGCGSGEEGVLERAERAMDSERAHEEAVMGDEEERIEKESAE